MANPFGMHKEFLDYSSLNFKIYSPKYAEFCKGLEIYLELSSEWIQSKANLIYYLKFRQLSRKRVEHHSAVTIPG